MDRYELKQEIMKYEDPYRYWISRNEGWRGSPVPHEVMQSFNDKYTFICRGKYVNDPDVYERFALYASKGDYDVIYCDEDEVSDGKRHDPYFKPDFSPDTLESFNYIGGFAAVSRNFMKNPSRDLLKLAPERILHIPEVLYHSRQKIEFGQYRSGETGRQTEEKSKELLNDGVSVIILTKDHPDLLERCVSSLKGSDLPDNTGFVIIDNGSSAEMQQRNMHLTEEYGLRYEFDPMPFNYSKLCNIGADLSKSRFLLFVNDDVEAVSISRNAVRKMCVKAAKANVGAVGIKLLYTDSRRIQHCGITFLKTGPSHKLCGYDDSVSHYFGINRMDINVMAVTGACLCIERKKFEEAGCFDEELPVAYNDVDLCLGLLEKGYYNVCMNSIYMLHHESASRADDRKDEESYKKLRASRNYFYEKHKEFIIKGDPFYNKNLTKTGLDYVPAVTKVWEESGVEVNGRLLCRDVRFDAKGVQGQIDSCKYRLSDAYGNEDFLFVSGWVMAGGRNPAALKKGVLFVNGDRQVLFSASDIYRRDVGKVFPKKKYAEMSGLVCRVSAQALIDKGIDGDIDIYPVLIKKNGIICKGEKACQIKMS